MISMPARMMRAHLKFLKPIIGLIMSLMARLILLDDVVQVLVLADLDRRRPCSVRRFG